MYFALILQSVSYYCCYYALLLGCENSWGEGKLVFLLGGGYPRSSPSCINPYSFFNVPTCATQDFLGQPLHFTLSHLFNNTLIGNLFVFIHISLPYHLNLRSCCCGSSFLIATEKAASTFSASDQSSRQKSASLHLSTLDPRIVISRSPYNILCFSVF